MKKVFERKVQIPKDLDIKDIDDEFVEQFVNKFVDKFVEEKFGTENVEVPDSLLFALQKDLTHVNVKNLNKNKTSYTLGELENACNGLLDEVRPKVEEYKTKSKIYFISTVSLIVAIIIKLFIIK